MDGLPVFLHPEPLVAAVAVLCLGLALSLEALMLALTLRGPQLLSPQPLPEQPHPHDFYDWLYE